MDIALVLVPALLVVGTVAFIAGQKFGVRNVCHSGKVWYGATWDRRIGVNIVLTVDKKPVRFAVRIPPRASTKIAHAILNHEDVDFDGGNIRGADCRLH